MGAGKSAGPALTHRSARFGKRKDRPAAQNQAGKRVGWIPEEAHAARKDVRN
jgi:hypothetical protein